MYFSKIYGIIISTIILWRWFYVECSGCRVSAVISEDLKAGLDTLFERLGLDISTAIKIFLNKCDMTQSIPFDVCAEDHFWEKEL